MSATDSRRIRDLVLQSQKGNVEAFGMLYELLLNEIYRYIYFRISGEEVGDLCEDVFLKAWEKLSSYREKKNSSFRSWLFTIAHNIVIDYYRKNKINIPVEDMTPFEDHDKQNHPTWDINHKLTVSFINKALQCLPDDSRQVVIMKYINELDYTEIADVMGKSETAIRIIIHRSLKELKTIIEKLNSK